ncbi:MAG: hypothetical protein ACRDF4_01235, partial [Rhabdochlamydiaceae bacterium]
LTQAHEVLNDLENALVKKKECWLQIRKDNPNFEEVSESNWREKSSRCWLHGGTELSETRELDQWLFHRVELLRLAKKRVASLLERWEESMDEAGSLVYFQFKNAKLDFNTESNETLFDFICKVVRSTEEKGRGSRIFWRALKNFLHYLRTTYSP